MQLTKLLYLLESNAHMHLKMLEIKQKRSIHGIEVFIGGCSATQILMFTPTLEIKQSIYWWL